jgi:two-component system cell cycle response regulator DivK
MTGRGTILVVDDYADNRELFAEYLAWHGFTTTQAADGRAALEAAFSRPPDAVLMDLSLPGIDGWAVTRKLKADPRTRDTRVLVLTGHALEDCSLSAFDAGCDAFLTKPCPPEVLLRRLLELLGDGHVPAGRA